MITEMTITEVGLGLSFFVLISSWIWYAASTVARLRNQGQDILNLIKLLDSHTKEENCKFDNISIGLHKVEQNVARIEGRLLRNGIEK